MKRTLPCSAALALISATVAGCTSETFDKANDYETVVTIRDQGYDYSQNSTYAVVDRLEDLSALADAPIEIDNLDEWEEIIVTRIHKNMKDLGYEEATGDIESADVVVAAGVVADENWRFYSYYPWWGWHGWYHYPYYPSARVAVDFSSGSVVMVMIDPDRTIDTGASSLDGGDMIDAGVDSGVLDESVYHAIWTAGIHGLLNYVDKAKVRSGIDQAFKQSDYLRIGGDK